jgi:hypothetical protein
MLLHGGRNEESIRNFFQDVYELYVKVRCNNKGGVGHTRRGILLALLHLTHLGCFVFLFLIFSQAFYESVLSL